MCCWTPCFSDGFDRLVAKLRVVDLIEWQLHWLRILSFVLCWGCFRPQPHTHPLLYSHAQPTFFCLFFGILTVLLPFIFYLVFVRVGCLIVLRPRAFHVRRQCNVVGFFSPLLALYGQVGYLTNYLALKMIFRPVNVRAVQPGGSSGRCRTMVGIELIHDTDMQNRCSIRVWFLRNSMAKAFVQRQKSLQPRAGR